MKSTITYTVLIVLAYTLFVSCNQKQSSKEASNSTESIIDSTNISWTPCKELDKYGEHEIKKEEAEESLSAYKDYIDRVKACLDSGSENSCDLPTKYTKEDILNYGSEVDFDLLLQVLTQRKLDCSHKLYLMNGIRPKRDENRKVIEGEFVTEIIFVHEAQSTSENEKEAIEEIYTYFDFTRPCPTGCPNIPGLEYLK